MSFESILGRVNRARIKYSCKLQPIQPQELLEGRVDLSVCVPMVATHWETASLFDHMFIASLVRALKPKVCFEIGTSLGLVTATIAANSSETTEVHTLDLSDEPRIGSFFRERDESRKIHQHFGSSESFDYAPLEGEVGLMFIDGSHEFEDVRRDSANAFKLISDKGVVVWHDVSPYFPGVIRALESLPQAKEIYLVQGTSCGIFVGHEAALTTAAAGERPATLREDSSETARHEYN
jgi:predicted O-methyltransferase YrrM